MTSDDQGLGPAVVTSTNTNILSTSLGTDACTSSQRLPILPPSLPLPCSKEHGTARIGGCRPGLPGQQCRAALLACRLILWPSSGNVIGGAPPLDSCIVGVVGSGMSELPLLPMSGLLKLGLGIQIVSEDSTLFLMAS